MRGRVLQKQNHPIKKVSFYSIFQENVPHVAYFWHLVETSQPSEPLLSLYQGNIFEKSSQYKKGKLLAKNEDTEQWEPFLFDLQPDRMFRKPLNADLNYQIDCCHLSACFIKKYNHQDSRMPGYKYGIRLQMGNHLNHFLADSAETFKKWFILLRRSCILEKFNRKYKVIAKLKYIDPMLGQCCYSAIRILDAGYYIVKIVEKDLLTSQQKVNFFKELHNLRRIQQIKLHTLFVSHTQLIYFVEVYEDETHIYQVFEHFLGSDLRQHLRDSQIYALAESSQLGLDEKLLSEIMYGLIQAVCHLHSKGVFHRDIKLDNIFVPDKRRLPFVILSNLCYSDNFKLSKNHQDQNVYKKCGTPGYVAPEIFKTKSYDTKVDVFSLGVVFFILVYGKMPFEGRDQEEILKANERGDIDFKQEKKICRNISQSGVEMLRQMLQKEPTKRISSSQCLNHHWFIKMKTKQVTKQQQQPKPPTRQRSLSTIVEGSEINDVTQSFYNPNLGTQNKLKSSQLHLRLGKILPSELDIQQQFQDKVEKEFDFQTLSEKLAIINNQSVNKAPSKKGHKKIQETYS